MARKPKSDPAEPAPQVELPMNIPPELIAAALAELNSLDLEIATAAGHKSAAFNRYEDQGVDRDVLKGLQKLSKGRTPEEALRFITNLTGYAVAARVIPPPADDRWAMSVRQVDLFTPAQGTAADDLRTSVGKKEGFSAGKKGHLMSSCRYGTGSPEFVGWRDGWTEGDALRKKLKPDSEKTEKVDQAGPRKRGRPRKNPDGEATEEAGTSVH